MALDDVELPNAVVNDDLVKPFFVAAWTGLLMAFVDTVFSRRQKLLFFGVIVLLGVVYFSYLKADDGGDTE